MKPSTEKLIASFPHLPPMIVRRSVERASSEGDLFDILSTVPTQMPVIWDEEIRRWTTARDILLREFIADPSE